MRLTDLRSSLVAVASALVASVCCLLPLAMVLLGLGSGAFMAVTMAYSALFVPVGVLGTAAGYVLYLRERRRCRRLGCRMAGSRLNLASLAVATVVLLASVALTAMPEATSRLIAAWGGVPSMPMPGPGEPVAGPAAPAVGLAADAPPTPVSDPRAGMAPRAAAGPAAPPPASAPGPIGAPPVSPLGRGGPPAGPADRAPAGPGPGTSAALAHAVLQIDGMT